MFATGFLKIPVLVTLLTLLIENSVTLQVEGESSFARRLKREWWWIEFRRETSARSFAIETRVRWFLSSFQLWLQMSPKAHHVLFARLVPALQTATQFIRGRGARKEISLVQYRCPRTARWRNAHLSLPIEEHLVLGVRSERIPQRSIRVLLANRSWLRSE